VGDLSGYKFQSFCIHPTSWIFFDSWEFTHRGHKHSGCLSHSLNQLSWASASGADSRALRSSPLPLLPLRTCAIDGLGQRQG
jgi:hypothetical protein